MSEAPRSRGLAFALLATVIVLGPIYGHYFATGSHKYLGWKMFSRKASDFCAVEYTRRGPEAQRLPLDRFQTLGVPADRRARHLWKVRDVRAAHRIGQQLCGKLGRDADVRVKVTCATKTGWRLAAPGEKNLCRRGS